MIAVLDQFNSKWARNDAAKFLLKPTSWNAVSMSFSESLSQWTNPELVVGGLGAGLVGWQSVLKAFIKNEKIAKEILNLGEVKRIYPKKL